MKHHLHTVAALALCGLFSSPTAEAQTVTPVQWLDSQPKPAFKLGHTLPRLTRYGWECLPLVTGQPLAKDWGYALEFTRYVTDLDAVARIDEPGSRESQTVALALANPQIYKLNVTTTQAIPFENAPYEAFTRDASGTILSAQGVSADGTTWGGVGPLISLEAPDSFWATAGELRAAPLRALINRGIPIDSIHNGGESGLGIPGFAASAWNMDPVIGPAIATSPWGQTSMNNHASARKANSELIIAAITKAAVPSRSFFNYYAAGGGVNRNQDWAIDQWTGRWANGRGINDFPSSEVYWPSAQFTGRLDAVTRVTNAVSLEIATGDTLSYNWITSGWDGYYAENARWVGFLKCYYTAGMIGANTGWYGNHFQGQYEAPFPQATPPLWLTQLIATSHVHALFSQLEDLVRNGDLLPGPARHSISPSEPAYEFPTGDDTARVLVRKRRDQQNWLITAWAADGGDRNVSVYIPEIGQLTVEARIVGSVYTASVSNGSVTLIRHDNEGAKYTAVAPGAPVVTPVNLLLPPPLAADRLVWLSADSGITADAAGKVSSWTNQGGNAAFSVAQANVTKRPTLIANAINGKPAIRFVNSQSWLEATGMGAIGDDFISPLTIFTVFTGAEVNGRQAVLTGFSLSDNYSNGDAFILSNRIENISELDNGVLLGSRNVNLAHRLSHLVVGNTNSDYGYGLTGDIAEVLIYKGLTPLKIAQVQLYLNDKYKISRKSALVGGDFESPVVTGYLCTPHNAGWFFAGNSVIQANGSAWNAPIAPSGNQTAILQGYDGRLGTMSQMVYLTAGSYNLGFKAARRSDQIQPLKISVDQRQIGSLIAPTSNSFAEYTTSSFTAKEGLHLIRFEATDGSGNKSTFIDQVVLTKATAPTTLQGGSFETPTVNGYQYNPTGSGWTFASNSAIQSNGSAWSAASAPDGNQTAVLQGYSNGLGSISQTVSFAAGTYTVSYKAARRPYGGVQPVKFSVDGTQVGNTISPASTGFSSYTTASFTVTAGEHVLRLEATDGAGDNSSFVDEVVLTPATAATLSVLGNSFETPAVSGYQYNPTGSGWSFTSNSAIQSNGSDWGAANAPEGAQTAVLQGHTSGLGAISQTLNFPAGTYTVSFKAARRGGQIQPVKVSVGGTQVGTSITPTSTAFATYTTASFTVAAGNQVLRLEATDGADDKSTFIDQVVVTNATPVASFVPAPDAPASPQVQPMRLSRSGAQRAIEYHRVVNESSPTVAETSNDLVTWVPVSTQPSLSITSETLGPNMEKITISLPNSDTRRFFRLRIG